MSVSLFGRAPGTWNEEAYFALPETSVKVELFDGDLLVSPRADFTHQDVSYKLHAAFRRRARAAGLRSTATCPSGWHPNGSWFRTSCSWRR